MTTRNRTSSRPRAGEPPESMTPFSPTGTGLDGLPVSPTPTAVPTNTSIRPMDFTPVRDSGFGKTGPLTDPTLPANPSPTVPKDAFTGKPVPGDTLGGPGPRNPIDYNNLGTTSTTTPPPGTPVQPPMSTGYPPGTTPPGAGTPGPGMPATPGMFGLDFMRQVTPNELVQNQLQGLLSGNSQYIQNARQRGAEYAASRGNINSSIGAGASQRAALEAAMPIAESDAGVYRQANEGNFAALNQLRQMRTAAELDNWLSSETYNRDFNGRLAMIPINSGADMLAYITQRALEDPAVYTPDVISGFNNFFNLNMQDMFRNFFGGGNG